MPPVDSRSARVISYRDYRYLLNFFPGVTTIAGFRKAALFSSADQRQEATVGFTRPMVAGRFNSSGGALTLETGLTYSPEFVTWVQASWVNNVNRRPASHWQRDFRMVALNEAGAPQFAYQLFRCWVSEYEGLPDLDANANAVAIEHIKFQIEGWRPS
jgi:phage tail-like protein